MRLYDPLKREHALAFGRVIAAWAYLETVVGDFIDQFYSHGTPMEMDGFLSAHLDYPKKRDLLSLIMSQAGISKAEQNQLIKELERLNKVRGTVAHSYWVEGRKSGQIKPAGARKGGRYLGVEDNEQNYSVEGLTSEARAMMQLSNKLTSLAEKHFHIEL